MKGLSQDFRHALRALARRPLFAFVAVLSLAVGIGANATMFSVINTMLLRQPPGVHGGDRLVEVGGSRQGGSGFSVISYRELEAIRELPVFEAASGFRISTLSLVTGTEPERILGFATSAEYFSALGARPALGRFFLPAEASRPGGDPVVVLSHVLWRDRFGADPGIIGRTIEVNRHAFTVVGVAAPEFTGHVPLLRPDLYLPLTMMAVAQPGFAGFADDRSWLQVVARLAPGVTPEQATAALDVRYRALEADDASRFVERSARAVPLSSVPASGRGAITGFLSVLMVLVGLILFVTCANVAGMLLARAAGREREIAIRLSLGAGRGRLVRQLLVESLVLFGAGGAAGVLLAVAGTRALGGLRLPTPFPVHFEFGVDGRVLLFGMTAALLTGLLFGLAPALQSASPQLTAALRNDGSRAGTRGGRLRRLFVGSQVALTVVLLVTAGLFLRSLQHAAAADTGFSAAGVSVVSYDLSIDGYDEARGRAFHRDLMARLGAAPGVTAVAASNDLPLDLNSIEDRVRPEGWSEGDDVPGMRAAFNRVSGAYFDALRIPLLRGRTFTGADADGEPVIIVSRDFAARAWPGEDPLGRRVHMDGSDGAGRTVVGVVGDVANSSFMAEPQPMFYLPMEQLYQPEVMLVVRSEAAPAATAALLRATLRQLDPRLSTTAVTTLAELNDVGLLPQRIAAGATAAFGLLALLLSALGIYGVTAFMVAQRTREIGIRMALGARRHAVVSMVVRSVLAIAVPGALLGMLGALGAGFLVRGFILGVTPLDPVTLIGAPLVLLAAVAAAGWQPAARASAVEPVRALRSEP